MIKPEQCLQQIQVVSDPVKSIATTTSAIKLPSRKEISLGSKKIISVTYFVFYYKLFCTSETTLLELRYNLLELEFTFEIILFPLILYNLENIHGNKTSLQF